jgi:hypothetical protein
MMQASPRSTPAFAIGGTPEAFACIVCGGEVYGYHFLDVRGICPKHCFEHEFAYQREVSEHRCDHCDEPAPRDWYDVDD